MIRRIEDWLLSRLQRRCKHPDIMVAVDIAEGMFDEWSIPYCRRCGAVRVERSWRFTESHIPWRLPDPHLWKDFAAGKSDPSRVKR
jgi:hypothetical protein